MAFAWLACPWTLYAMNANANDGLVALLAVATMLALRSPAARRLRRPRRGRKFGPAALAPLFATGTGERRLRSIVVFAVAFVVVVVALFAPFIPDGGFHELYDRTLGYQASRSSPFSIWGLAPSLDFLRVVVRVRFGGARDRRRVLPAFANPDPDRGPRRRRDHRGPARRDPLVLLLRGLVPAVRPRRELRLAALSRWWSAARRAAAS